MKASWNLFLVAAALSSALGCIDFEQEKLGFCQSNPARCPPQFLASGSYEVPLEEGTHTLWVRAHDSLGGDLRFSWQLDFGMGTLNYPQSTPTSSQVIWKAPLCMPTEQGVIRIFVQAINSLDFSATTSFEFKDIPRCPQWAQATDLDPSRKRASHTSTRLHMGQVLVAGGAVDSIPLDTAAVYHPAAGGTWSSTPPMTTPRAWHTATLLPSKRVLVTGGFGPVPWPECPNETQKARHKMLGTPATAALSYGPVSSAEVFEPVGFKAHDDPDSPGHTEPKWVCTPPMSMARSSHTASLISTSDGRQKVLVAGGLGPTRRPTEASEEYDLNTGTWSATVGRMHFARAGHTATLLPSGRLLVIGGTSPAFSASSRDTNVVAMSAPLASAELYDPDTGQWFLLPHEMTIARSHHTATLLPSGKVLVTGGFHHGVPLTSSEIFDPSTQAEPWSTEQGLFTSRAGHTAVLLTSGRILVAAGVGMGGPLASAEVYAPDTRVWSVSSSLVTPRTEHTATLLFSGAVLVTGGANPWDGELSSTEFYTPESLSPPDKSLWIPAGGMSIDREQHTATELPLGKVLVAGGLDANGARRDADVYDPTTNTWVPIQPMSAGRYRHTATLLPSGKILVAGGRGASANLATAEIYDPATSTWSPTGSLATARYRHTATLLLTGKVLVVGGRGNSGNLASAQLYDPAAGTWASTGSLSTARSLHDATLLSSGQVLVTGGTGASGSLASAELYDPVAGTWSPAAIMPTAHPGHRAILLLSGKVLVTGGQGSMGVLSSTALYDPFSNAWTPNASMSTGRAFHTATLLPTGRVLVTGGFTATAEVYDPETGVWSPIVSMLTERTTHTASLLPSGRVLVTGGNGEGFSLSSTELYLP